MEQSPGERKLEAAFLFTVTAANYDWPVGRRHCLDRIKCKGKTDRERERGREGEHRVSVLWQMPLMMRKHSWTVRVHLKYYA